MIAIKHKTATNHFNNQFKMRIREERERERERREKEKRDRNTLRTTKKKGGGDWNIHRNDENQ
jgi:hypothetical protein